MKNLLFYVFAALAFAACTQNEIDELSAVRQDAPATLTVGFEGDDTRIQLNEAQKTVWTKDDLVSVFYLSNANQKWQYQGETGERVGVLKCVESALPTKETDYVVVAYPYNDNYYLNASSCNLRASLPATQHYLKDSYGLDGNIMVSRGEYNQVSLRNVCGWLKVQLAGDNQVVKSIKLYGNNGEQVAGELYINTNDATAILASDMGIMPDSDEEGAGGVGGGLQFNNTIYTDVTLVCDEEVVLGNKATAFYIALPPQTFENGVTVEVKCKGYEPMVISTDNALTIQRNHIKPMETVEFNAAAKPEMTFEISIEEVTKSSVTYSVTPSDLNAEYLCILYDAATVEDFIKDEYLVATIYQELTAEAAFFGQTFAEYMPTIVDKGAIDSAVFNGLAFNSDYYLLVFGVDPANNYKASTEVVKTKFTTLEAEMMDCTFEVTPEVNLNTVKLSVVPSDKEAMWHLFIVPESMWEQYVSHLDGYQMSPETFYIEYLNSEIQQYLAAGYTEQQVIDAIFLVGDKTLEIKDLNANTDYFYVIAGISADEESTYVSTEIFKGPFKTGDAAKPGMTFDISVTDIEAMRAAIKIVPSNNTETFCWMCGQWDGKATAEELMNQIVARYGSWMNNNGAMLYKGVQDCTGGPGSSYKYKVDAPDTDYYVLAFGYADGITTAPEMVTFHTLPGADPMEVEFSMVASNITPYSTDIAITVSDDSVYYIGSAISHEGFNEEELVALFNEDFDYIFEMSKEFDPFTTTVASVLRQYCWNGSQQFGATGLLPETELMGFIFALDMKTGHVARVITFPDLATTPALGSVTPSIELVGYYSGDEEAGSVFGQPAATKGKAITVVKYDNLEGARMLFTLLFEDDWTNVPDTDLWAATMGYWQSCKVNEPYTFYVAEWEAIQTALVYAVDSTGNPGSLGRLYTVATAADKSPIDELKTLYDSLTASTSATKASVVIGEPRQSTAPIITNLTPAKAEVVAPAVVEEVREVVATELPSMVKLERILPFRLR